MSHAKTLNPKQVDELEQIRLADPDLVLRPVSIVRSAKRKSSPLHDLFEWDDRKAGNAFRIWQARKIIARVEIIPHPSVSTPTRLYVSFSDDRIEDGGGYRNLITVLKDADLREQLVDQALEELTRIQQKYEQLVELKEIFDAIAETAAARRKKTSKKRRKS